VRYTGVQKTATEVRGKMSVDVKDKEHHGETDASCSADGIKTALGGLEGIALATSGLNAKVLSSEGVTLPPEEALRKRRPWKNAVSVELRPPPNANLPLKINPVIRTTFTREAVVVGEERVTVGAGTYQALKIKNTTTAAGVGPESARSLDSVLWIAPNVGIVKVMTGDHVDMELLEMSRSGHSTLR
jgi:hypothetical protein